MLMTALACSPARAQTKQQIDWCVDKDKVFSTDLRIGGCTAVIQSGKWSGKGLAWAFNNRGAAYHQKNDFDRAIADYSEAIRLDPKYALAFGNRGSTYDDKKEFDRAIADYNEAIRLNPKYAVAFNNRGVAHRNKKEFDRAIADYSEAIRLDPKYALAFNNRGLVHYGKKEFDRAIADYSEAIRLNPKYAEAINNRTLAEREKNDPNRTITDYKANANAQQVSADVYRRLNLFGDVFERVRADYVRKPDDGRLIESAMNGMLVGAGISSTVSREQVFCMPGSNANPTYIALQCFGSFYEAISAQVRGRISDADLISSAINGMLNGLDTRSSYMEPKTFRDMQVQTRGELGGIGLELTMEGNRIKVVSAIDGTPAAKTGVMADDIITRFDEEQAQGLTLNQAIEKLRGPVNTTIKLTIRRKGQDTPVELSIARDIIRVRAVRSRVENDIGYIRISQFNEQATENLRKELRDLQTQIPAEKLKGYIVDLRNNPGGLLDQAIAVADAFLERGEIVSTRGRNPEETQRFSARPGDLARGKPVIVLINGGSASASEIVAGALQDHKRATLVGSRSFGRGSVETIITLGAGNGALRLTTSHHHTPSGRSVEGAGIVPDIEVLQDVPPDARDDKALNKAISLLRGNASNTVIASPGASAPGTVPTLANASPASQSAAPTVSAPQAIGRRVALVIGNSAYSSVVRLPNPGRDAEAVAAALRTIGFATVMVQNDVSRDGFIKAMRAFADEADKADWAMVYYAGHGIEVGGLNYLVPVDARLQSDRDVVDEAISLDRLLSAVEGARKIRLVVLDACRDNPFATRIQRTAASRSVGRGLARVEPRAGTIVFYATKDGQIANDGDGQNSPFTTAFLKRLAMPGLEVRRMIDLVRDDVMDATNDRQQPFHYGSVSGREEFYFVGAK
jgi:carboxyl-terminal processing protease